MGLQKYSYYLKSIFTLLGNTRPCATVLHIFWRSFFPSHRTPQDEQASLQIIQLPHEGTSFWVRGAMDVWSVKETFLDRFYERFGVPIGEGWTIVDIGGGIGDFTILAAKAHPQNLVYAFEPTPDSYKLLQTNLALNEVGNVQAFGLAIWSTQGSLVMDTSVGEPGQFISRNTASNADNEPFIQVESISLAQAFEQLNIRHCDLLKMDCEGAEYPILFTTPAEIFERVERIIMEYHDQNLNEYNEINTSQFSSTHQGLERFLSGHGYIVQVVQNYVHANLGYLYAYRQPRETNFQE